ncbi:MAG: DUF1566 domain-containing protein [Desulfurivibrionaceae bacterium]|nr:DUF1566 domain-containing protein [Desulfurivibrionaceae bacterium]
MKTWKSALADCEGLALAGNSDCRLPNIKEMESLTDDSRYNPAIDRTFFPGVNASYYWSSASYAGSTANAWYVGFLDGCVGSYDKTGDGYVRCVC